MSMEKAKLEAIASDHCDSHAQEVLTSPVSISIDAQESAWDPIQLRTVFAQQMSLWRKYGSFEVIADSSLRIVGYVDGDKCEGEGGGALPREELLALFQSEPLIPRTASIIEIQSQRQTSGVELQRVLFSLRWPVGGLTKMEVLVNAKRRAIAAVRPLV